MADIKFSCPQCQQAITCDELWCGHQIQCPGCQGNLTVPPKPAEAGAAPVAAPADSPLVPKPPAATKLSIGQAHKKPEAAAAAPQRSVPIRNLTPPPPKKKNPAVKIAVIGAVVVALGAGGYFGYGWYDARQKAKAEAEAAEKEAQAKAAAAAAQADAAKAEEKPLPALPPVWTLDLADAKIPQGRANGSVAGTNFVVETARIDTVGAAQVLRLLQGPVASPDREFLIYLHPKPGEKLAGQTFSIAADTKGAGMPSVIKRWKTNPKYAATAKSFANGYVMKLELGQAAADGAIPGKIFLAVPDKEQSVVGGSFKASTAPLDPNAQYAQPQQPVAAPAADPASAGQRSTYERRYGIRR